MQLPASSCLRHVKISDEQRLVLSGGDFYCFRLEALVSDLSDVTGGYAMPSFIGTSEPQAEFDLRGAAVTLEMEVFPDRLSLFARRSTATFEFDLP